MLNRRGVATAKTLGLLSACARGSGSADPSTTRVESRGQMSDCRRELGWWQASDLKWYPPELHPDYVPPLPSPPTDGVAQTRDDEVVPLDGPPPAGPFYIPPIANRCVQMPAMVSSVTVKDTLARLSVTAWLLFAGL